MGFNSAFKGLIELVGSFHVTSQELLAMRGKLDIRNFTKY
jgi:hypothetical protein